MLLQKEERKTDNPMRTYVLLGSLDLFMFLGRKKHHFLFLIKIKRASRYLFWLVIFSKYVYLRKQPFREWYGGVFFSLPISSDLFYYYRILLNYVRWSSLGFEDVLSGGGGGRIWFLYWSSIGSLFNSGCVYSVQICFWRW